MATLKKAVTDAEAAVKQREAKLADAADALAEREKGLAERMADSAATPGTQVESGIRWSQKSMDDHSRVVD